MELTNNDSNDVPESPQRGMIPRDDLPFLPRVNWKFWAPIIAFCVTMVGAWFISDHRRTIRLRNQLLSEHALLTRSLAPSYTQLRTRIERLVFSTVGPWQGTYTAPGFTMRSLSDEVVLYGRVRMGELHTVGDVSASIGHRYADQVASCLGLETNMVHELYRKGDFLMPTYVESVRGIESGDRLAALRQDLQFRLRRDTPDIVQESRRRYLVVSVDEAALSIDGPTRVYIWDLRTEQPVFRARGAGDETIIIPIRIAGMPGGGRTVPQPTSRLTLTQHDCAVANVAREQLGVDVLTLRNAPAIPTEPAPAATDAAAPSSIVPAAASPSPQ